MAFRTPPRMCWFSSSNLTALRIDFYGAKKPLENQKSVMQWVLQVARLLR